LVYIKKTQNADFLKHGVAGSPFSTWASSASLLKVTGPGIEHGVLSTFKSVFEVDATEAGPGDLRVRVGGRRGLLKPGVFSSRGQRGLETEF